jgi:hypothetical protein
MPSSSFQKQNRRAEFAARGTLDQLLLVTPLPMTATEPATTDNITPAKNMESSTFTLREDNTSDAWETRVPR